VETLKDQLEGQENCCKIYILTLLYTTRLQEACLDVDGYVKSMETVWRRLNDANLNLPEELVVVLKLRVFPRLAKDLQAEALRLKAEQASNRRNI
jgi:hypothetical protein